MILFIQIYIEWKILSYLSQIIALSKLGAFLCFTPSFDAFSSNSLSSQALGFFLIACGLRFFFKMQ
jgi:hypothetical protein